MKTKTNLLSLKITILILLIITVSMLAIISAFNMSSSVVLAEESDTNQSEVEIEAQDTNHTEINTDVDIESCTGYGCKNGEDLKEDLHQRDGNELSEPVDGFGCGSTCGASREDGYSANYSSGCKNWQVMPLISPMFKYWIDESTLEGLSDSDKQLFISNVDKAAQEWNSVRIADYSGPIVNLQKQSENGVDVVPIKYDPNLTGCSGKFNPVPLVHWIKIKSITGYNTMLHEFGHMIGLQDLDLNNNPGTHVSLMGYARGNTGMHYQDIQGLAVANGKHTHHVYDKYYEEDGLYKYVCFYCDMTDFLITNEFEGGTPLVDSSTCSHNYKSLVSVGQKHWYKCTKCYKVTENPTDYFNKDVFRDFGYNGSTFYWNGIVRMRYRLLDTDNNLEVLKVLKGTKLQIELSTFSSLNELSEISGTVSFELINKNDKVLQTHTSTVKVDVLNQVEITDNVFTINTSDLDNGIYTLKLTSNFNRMSWNDTDEQTFTIRINQPETVITDFGYLSSWYKWNGELNLNSDYLYSFEKNDLGQLVVDRSTKLNFEIGTEFAFNAVYEINSTITFSLKNSDGVVININGNSTHVATSRVGLASNVTYTNGILSIDTSGLSNGTYTLTLNNVSTRNGTRYTQTKEFTFVVSSTSACISKGTLITLADGSQVKVEDLTGNEELLVWNMLTGSFDTAPILFIDSEEEMLNEVINLTFSDGTVVKVIDEHAFYDLDLNKYVFLRDDAEMYIGHKFNKQVYDENGNMVWTSVELTDVEITNELIVAYSPVTYSHLCYYVNGMLSMPGATEGFINIFDVNAETMTIDQDKMQMDIAQYGLYTYEEFAEIYNVPEEIFNAFNGQYMKIAIGKGLITEDQIQELINRYSKFFEQEEITQTKTNNGNHYGQIKNNNNGLNK